MQTGLSCEAGTRHMVRYGMGLMSRWWAQSSVAGLGEMALADFRGPWGRLFSF